MPGPKFCSNCIHWEKVAPTVSGDNFGICHDISVASKVALDGQTNLSEEGTFWTEAFFGCVYWRENDGSLFSFDDILTDENLEKATENMLDKSLPGVEHEIKCNVCGAVNSILNKRCSNCKRNLE